MNIYAKILLSLSLAAIILITYKLIYFLTKGEANLYKEMLVSELLRRGFTPNKIMVQRGNIYIAVGEISFIRITMKKKGNHIATSYALGFMGDPEFINPAEIQEVKALIKHNTSNNITTEENLARLTLALLDIDKMYKETPRHIDKKML